MIAIKSLKHLYLRKKIFTVTSIRKILHMQITHRQKEFLNTLKYLREYYNFYIQRETLLLTDVFENF